MKLLTGFSKPHQPPVLVPYWPEPAGLTYGVRQEPDMDLWPRVLSPSHNSKKALDLRNHLWPSGNRTVSPEAGLFPCHMLEQ